MRISDWSSDVCSSDLAYADTLRTLAEGGPSAFYHGDIARAIVARTHQPPLGGAMSEQDLADYEPTTGEPICRPLRQYVLCVPPPPTSGVGLLQLMALLDGTDIDQRGPDDPPSWFLFAEEIGRAPWRERVLSVRVDLGGRRMLKKKRN